MGQVRMVPLVTATSGFEAKLLAARLGSEGFLWEIRGGVDGLYPVGTVEVLVAETDAAEARELLLVDEIEDALDPVAVDRSLARSWPTLVLALVVVAVIVGRLATAARL